MEDIYLYKRSYQLYTVLKDCEKFMDTDVRFVLYYDNLRRYEIASFKKKIYTYTIYINVNKELSYDEYTTAAKYLFEKGYLV